MQPTLRPASSRNGRGSNSTSAAVNTPNNGCLSEKGRGVDFKNTLIIMTSNIGSHYLSRHSGIIQENFEGLERKNLEEVIEKTQREVMDLLRKTVRPEFREAISVLASEASKRNLATRQGARSAHSRCYARDE